MKYVIQSSFLQYRSNIFVKVSSFTDYSLQSRSRTVHKIACKNIQKFIKPFAIKQIFVLLENYRVPQERLRKLELEMLVIGIAAQQQQSITDPICDTYFIKQSQKRFLRFLSQRIDNILFCDWCILSNVTKNFQNLNYNSQSNQIKFVQSEM